MDPGLEHSQITDSLVKPNTKRRLPRSDRLALAENLAWVVYNSRSLRTYQAPADQPDNAALAIQLSVLGFCGKRKISR
jgi:hypothetical protein